MTRGLVVVVCFCVLASYASAEPEPFGLKIKEDTYDVAQGKRPGEYAGINKYSSGKMYDLNVSDIDIDGLKSVRAIFGKDDILVAVIAEFNKNRYNALRKNLASKYQVISQRDPFVGDKSTKFKDDNTYIELEAPHLSFHLTLSYIHEHLNRVFLEKSAAEKEKKKEREANTL